MDEQLLTILKLCLLALLYLFFLRVLRAVWTEVRGPRTVDRRARKGTAPALAAAPAGAAPVPVAPLPAAAESRGSRRAERKADRHSVTGLAIVEPANLRGTSFPLADEITVGRAAGCHVTLDDTFASQIHARVFNRDGQIYVEDLGSTNGTYLNRNKVAGPQVMHRGDRLQVGNTVLELV